MGLLTEKGKRRYALAIGKRFIGVCDRKFCRRLIPVDEIYTVIKWRKRPDKLTFLGAIPEKIICKNCQYMLHPIPDVKKHKEVKGAKKLKTSLSNFFTKYYESQYTTKLLIAKFQKKAKFKKLKKKEFTKALRELKKEKVLQFKEKQWSLRKDKTKAKK